MAQDPLECVGQTFMGVVKSYSPTKGYGFVTSDKLAGDLFFMHKNLPLDVADKIRYGSDFYLSGSEIAFTCDISPEGKPIADRIKIILGGNGGGKKGGGKGKGKSSSRPSYEDDWGESDWGGKGKGYGKSSKGGKKGGGGGKKPNPDAQMPGEPLLDSERVQATIKSYSNGSKWGFARVDESVGDFGDIFVHYNNLDASMADEEITLRDGDLIEFRMELVEGKPVARDVTIVEQDASMYNEQWMRGIIKSFNDAQGFGFISAPRIWGDVRFLKADMPRFLLSSAQGTRVLFKLTVGPDGKSKAQMVNIVGSTDKMENVERLQEVVGSLKEDGYVDDTAAKTLGQTPCDELFAILPDLEFYKAENPSSFILGALSRIRKQSEKGGGRYRERPSSYGKESYGSWDDWGYDWGKGSWGGKGGKYGGGKGKSGGKGKGRSAPY